MSIVLQRNDFKRGDPNIGQPDFLCGNRSLEITLASNDKKNNNFIQKYADEHKHTKNL